MCNNTSRDPVKVQQSADASSDSEEFSSEKIADTPMDEQMNHEQMNHEQMNHSNNSNASLSQLNSQLNSAADQPAQAADGGLANGDSFGSSQAGRLLQTMNLLLSSQLSTDSAADEPSANAAAGELIETIQRLLAQSGNQTIASSLLAAAASQRTNSFACKFCTFTTAKRQQLIRHVRTNCEGLLAVMATSATGALTSATNSATNSTATSSITSSITGATTKSTTNSTNADCSSPTGEQTAVGEETAGQLLSPAVLAALNHETGCGNMACVNSNCTNGNSCVLLPNAGGMLNDKLKSIGQPADDSEEDYANSANPQDRYCTECEIQFVSYKNYRVSHFFHLLL